MENTVTPSRIVTVYRKGAMTMSFWKKQKGTEKVPQPVEQEMPQSAQEHSAQGETKSAYRPNPSSKPFRRQQTSGASILTLSRW